MARERLAVGANRHSETNSVSQWVDGKWEGLDERLDHTEVTITQQLLQAGWLAGRCWGVMTRTLGQGLFPEEVQQQEEQSRAPSSLHKYG